MDTIPRDRLAERERLIGRLLILELRLQEFRDEFLATLRARNNLVQQLEATSSDARPGCAV